MQCDSDWCSNADTQDLKENCKDSRLSTKNDLDDTCINIAASMQCDSDWCTNADTQDLKETCTDARLSPKRSTTSPDEQIKELRILFELLEDMLRSPDYDEDLQDELIKACPNYRTILLTAKRDLLRNDCGIVVVGETSAGKTTLINQLVGKNVFVTGILPTTGKITRIRNSQTMKIRCYSKDETITKEKEVQDVKNLKSIIKNLSHIQMRSRYLPDIYFVDVYLPVPILKGNVIIVDTPAIGENESLDNILLDYLPYAVSFVFVVNAKQHSSGIHENKLLKFLKTIMDNREKMPCFDPREVLFLTNQWDLIENYDSSSEEDDDNFWEKNDQHTQTWYFIQREIEKVWCAFDVENCFRVSLKQVGKGIDNYFTSEYKRFETRLQETIEKNKNKRVEFYYRFLKDFIRNAERGTLARLQMLKKSEEQQGIINQNILKIRYLQTKCQESSKELERYKNTIITKLAEKLYHYLNSPCGREDILNPSETKRICEVSYKFQLEEVPSRLKSGINRWCKGQEVKIIIDDAEAKIRSHVKYISSKLQEFEIDMTETDQSVQYSLNGDFNLLKLLPLHSASVISVAAGLVSLPIFLGAYLFSGSERNRKLADMIYDDCLSQMSMSVLKERFENSVGVEYSNVILSIFEKSLPNILNILTVKNISLLDTHKSIKQKQESLMRLEEKIWKIQEATKHFEKIY